MVPAFPYDLAARCKSLVFFFKVWERAVSSDVNMFGVCSLFVLFVLFILFAPLSLLEPYHPIVSPPKSDQLYIRDYSKVVARHCSCFFNCAFVDNGIAQYQARRVVRSNDTVNLWGTQTDGWMRWDLGPC